MRQRMAVFVVVLFGSKHFLPPPVITAPVQHVTGNDQDYLRKIPRVVVQKSALL
jgi:hypothetical protein